MSTHFYLTTAIDYPNGAPHVGHLYEKIIADTYARWYRFLGRDVFFLTGTDDNGQKLVKAAQAAGAGSTKTYVDENAAKFKALCEDLHLTIDDFIRTTEPRHIKVTQAIWQKLEAAGDIYFDRYSGLYCYSCETFYLESQVTADKKCPVHGTSLDFISEDGYFFKMSRYRDWIKEFIRSHESFIFPNASRKEILSRLDGDELKDLSVSRPGAGWGIPVPSNPKHVVYTWFDALINYYTAVYDEPRRSRFWPASMHVIGKDIAWFHTVIWPIMLHACGIALPEQVYVHGMILAEDGRKMSKSLNNVIDPYALIGAVPIDLIRYYFVRAVASGQDGCFAMKEMIDRNNNELANDFGNLALRVIKLAQKRLGDAVDASGVRADFDFTELGAQMSVLMDAREHHRAVDKLWEGINQVNAYLNTHEPWRIKDDTAKFKQYIYNGLYAVYCFATLAQAFFPDAAAKTLLMLGNESAGMGGLKFGAHTFRFSDTSQVSLFPKIEKAAASG